MINLLKKEIDPFTLSEGLDNDSVKNKKLENLMKGMYDS